MQQHDAEAPQSRGDTGRHRPFTNREEEKVAAKRQRQAKLSNQMNYHIGASTTSPLLEHSLALNPAQTLSKHSHARDKG